MPRRQGKTNKDRARAPLKGRKRKTKKVSLNIRIAKRNKKELTSKSSAGEELDLTPAPELIPEPNKIEREKRLIMWSGVSFFMLLFVFIWAFNVKSVFEKEMSLEQSNQEQFDVKEISDKFNQTLKEVSQNLAKLDNIATSSSATTTDEQLLAGEINQKEVEQLRSRLEELEKKVEKENKATSSNQLP